jgi:taurine dioxygenase
MDILPFEAALGAEVQGLDASTAQSATTFQKLRAALDQHLVLLLRDQTLDDPALITFSEGFGELDPPGPNPYGAPFLPEHPEINVISNVIEDGKPIGNLGAGEAVWHADMTYISHPPKAALLYAIEVPPGQGDTFFSNQFAAYEQLPKELAEITNGQTAIHDGAHNSAGILRKGHVEPKDPTETVGAQHPLARYDSSTDKRALFLGRRPHSFLPGLSLPHSEATLDALWEQATKPNLVWRHSWRAGDLIIWNNLGVLHRREPFDASIRRIMHRTQIKGDQAVSAGPS